MYFCNIHVALLLALCIQKSKSSSNYDLSLKEADNEFRLKKYNEIWQKAQLVLNMNDQRELYGSLVEFDKLSLMAKHEGISSKNPKLSSVDIDRQLAALLRKFSLNDIVDSLAIDAVFNHNPVRDENADSEEETLKSEHPGLLSLWQQAQSAGFEQGELSNLKQELSHFAEKQERHNTNLKRVSHAENSVHLDLNASEELGEEISILKQENQMLNSEMHRLAKKIANEKAKLSDKQFANAKTRLLWEAALKSGNFTSEQLNDLRYELGHFDDKINKLNIAQSHLDDSKFRWNKKGKYEYENMDEYRMIKRKLRDYERNVDKLEKYFQRKVEL